MALLLHLKLYVIKQFYVYIIFINSGHGMKGSKSRRAKDCPPWLLDCNIHVADGLDLLPFIPFPIFVLAL